MAIVQSIPHADLNEKRGKRKKDSLICVTNFFKFFHESQLTDRFKQSFVVLRLFANFFTWKSLLGNIRTLPSNQIFINLQVVYLFRSLHSRISIKKRGFFKKKKNCSHFLSTEVLPKSDDCELSALHEFVQVDGPGMPSRDVHNLFVS